MSRLDLGTARQLLAEQGLSFALRALRHPFGSLALAALREAEPGDWYVCVLAVEASFRGLGLGSALLADAEERAIATGASALSLIVARGNEAARRLYASLGFVERGRVEAMGHVSIRMAKELRHG